MSVSGQDKKDDSLTMGYWGWDLISYGDYGHAEEVNKDSEIPKKTGRGCICGQDSVDREEDRVPMFHSNWCPVSVR